jgi:hypothetical protein
MTRKSDARLYFFILSSLLLVGMILTVWSVQSPIPESQRLVTQGQIRTFAEEPLLIRY